MSKKRIAIYCSTIGACVLVVLVFVLLLKGSATETKMAATSEKTTSSKTVLIAGVDDAGANTDMLMLCRIDQENKRVHLVQIPRDTYYRNEKGSGKINRIYRISASKLGKKRAAEEMAKEFSTAFGITIDAYVVFDTRTVAEFVDLVGGVSVNVPYEIPYFDGRTGTVLTIPAGVQILNGEKSIAYLRHRKSYAEGDLGRLDAQLRFLSGLSSVLPSLKKIDRILAIYQKIIPNLLTNLTEKDIMEVMMAYFKNHGAYSVFLSRLPGEACYTGGVWYYALYRGASEQILRDLLGSSARFDPERRFTDDDREALSNIYFSPDRSYRVYTPDEVNEKKILHS